MRLKVAIAAVATLAFAAPALAAPMSGNIEVRYDDLNLSSSKGFARLSRRIDTTAERLCNSGSFDLSARMANRACRADVTGQAHAMLRNQLTASPLQIAQR